MLESYLDLSFLKDLADITDPGDPT